MYFRRPSLCVVWVEQLAKELSSTLADLKDEASQRRAGQQKKYHGMANLIEQAAHGDLPVAMLEGAEAAGLDNPAGFQIAAIVLIRASGAEQIAAIVLISAGGAEWSKAQRWRALRRKPPSGGLGNMKRCHGMANLYKQGAHGDLPVTTLKDAEAAG